MSKMITVVAAVVLLILVFLIPRPTGVWINCGISEISPDFTTEMRLACRNLRATKL